MTRDASQSLENGVASVIYEVPSSQMPAQLSSGNSELEHSGEYRRFDNPLYADTSTVNTYDSVV